MWQQVSRRWRKIPPLNQYLTESITEPEMNTSAGSYLASILIPARCDGATNNVSAFLKCLAGRGLDRSGMRRVAERNLAVKQGFAATEMTAHLCNDIGMTQGQYIAAQLAPVMGSQQNSTGKPSKMTVDTA